MGIEGAVPTAAAMMRTIHPAAHGPTELLRKSIVAISDVDCYDSSSSSGEHDEHSHALDTEERALAAELRRRTSIPSTFTYGADMALGAAAASSSAITGSSKTSEERRWRSFDCAGLDASASSSTIAGRSQSMDLLESRIQLENDQVSKCCAKLGRDRRLSWVRGLKGVFQSSSKKEQVQLLQMHLVAEVAKGHRSLTILHDTRLLLQAIESNNNSDVESSRSSSISLLDDPSTQKLLDGITHADQLLADDNQHHILSLQSQWLQALVRLHADKKLCPVHKPLGVAPATVLQQFLSDFVTPDGAQRVPCAFDLPTSALVRFEKIVTKCKLLKPALKRALDDVCRETMATFTRSSASANASTATSVFANCDARDVMQALVREVVDAIATEATVGDAFKPIVRAFTEQMVFSRLAVACYYGEATELDELNDTWREQVAKAAALELNDVGLPACVSIDDAPAAPFAKAIAAFNAMPHVVPSCVLAAFLNAVRVVYREASEQLHVAPSAMSADVLLPLLVFVLSRSALPHLHSQVFLMKEFAIDASQDGSEAAYYLACLQAAMGYIMTRENASATMTTTTATA